MAGAMAKDLKDLIPAFDDQGIPNATGAYQRGVSVQHLVLTVASDPETITFVDQGLSDMADADYVVIGQNQTDSADPPNFDAKATTSFQINGPDAADEVDIIIVGKLKGQLS